HHQIVIVRAGAALLVEGAAAGRASDGRDHVTRSGHRAEARKTIGMLRQRVEVSAGEAPFRLHPVGDHGALLFEVTVAVGDLLTENRLRHGLRRRDRRLAGQGCRSDRRKRNGTANKRNELLHADSPQHRTQPPSLFGKSATCKLTQGNVSSQMPPSTGSKPASASRRDRSLPVTRTSASSSDRITKLAP